MEIAAAMIHLLGFGMLATALLAGWILEHRQHKEPELKQKLFILSLGRPIEMLMPAALVLLLISGMAALRSAAGTPAVLLLSGPWFHVKLILSAILAADGIVIGPLLLRTRRHFLAGLEENIFSENLGGKLKRLNGTIRLYYLSQAVLTAAIVCASVYGINHQAGILLNP